MNWRRGLLRLWIVGTVLFVLAVAFISYSEIKKEFRDTGLERFLLMPQLCGDARGVAGTDYSTQQDRNPKRLCQRACRDDQAAVRTACERRDGRLDLAGVAHDERAQFHAE